ncbi:hypothetical protein [Guptibacillus hwajinpoensis]|uniref:hypothetical protein n=1 Tax=Guptibacillus hwajinpoensis TaxID=208199 RepID=UPI0038503B61
MDIKKFFKPLLLLGILLLSMGCTNSEDAGTNAAKSESEQNIRAILQKLFTGPNGEQKQLIEGSNGDLEEYANQLSEYYQENFKPYLSERSFENYIVNGNGAWRFLRMAHPDYKLKVNDINVEENDNYYSFTVKVSYTKSNESKTVNVKGHAQTNEEDKVTSIQFINPEDLRTVLN